MVFRRLRQPGERMPGGQPSGNRIEQPELAQDFTVGNSRCLCGLIDIARGRRIENRCVRGGCARRGRVRGEPATQRGRPTNRVALICEFAFYDHIQIAVQLSPTRPGRQWSDPRKARADDLVRIVLQRQPRLTANRTSLARQQLTQSNCRLNQTTLAEGERTQANSPNSARAGVHRGRDRLRTTGQQKTPASLVLIELSPNQIPDCRVTLPFVDQHRSWQSGDPTRIGRQECDLVRIIQRDDGRSATSGGHRLADPFGAVEADGREIRKHSVEFTVDNPLEIARHPVYATSSSTSTLPLATNRDYLWQWRAELASRANPSGRQTCPILALNTAEFQSLRQRDVGVGDGAGEFVAQHGRGRRMVAGALCFGLLIKKVSPLKRDDVTLVS